MALALSLAREPQGGANPGLRPSASALRRLSLHDFRSYSRLRLEVDPRPVVLTGPNGAGKTNLLEAISFLSPGRGLRRARLAEADRIGGGAWSVSARLEGARGALDLATGRVQDGGLEDVGFQTWRYTARTYAPQTRQSPSSPAPRRPAVVGRGC